MNSTTTRATHARTPIPFTDERGIACLRVPLDDRGRNFATVEADDYDYIVRDLGCRAAWCLTKNGHGERRYVVVNPPRVANRGHRLITVTRLFAGVGAGKFVRYATADTLDLRRSNLVIGTGTGRARHNCEAFMAEAVQRRKAGKAGETG